MLSAASSKDWELSMTLSHSDSDCVRARVREDARAREHFLAAIVQCPSDNPPGDCAAIAKRTAGLLQDLGFEVERHAVPSDLVAEHGMVAVTNLVVRRRFGDGPVIALNAHGDVVPPGEGWAFAPYGAEVVDSFMYGRGVAVSKSDFATYAFALRAIEPIAASLRGTVELHFTFDEEAGGLLGPAWLLAEGMSRPDLCISAGLSYGIVTAHNGVLHLEVETRGRSAHAAAPETGADALEAMTNVLAALYAERELYRAIVSQIVGIGSPQLTVGLVSGGINTNVVPDRVTIRLDRRVIPDEDPEAVEVRLGEVVAGAVAGRDGISAAVRRILLVRPLVRLPGADRLIEILSRRATETFGTAIGPTGVPLYTDARLYAEAEVPTVGYGAGPRSFLEANGHRADERLSLDDLARATETVALTLGDLLTD
jgi:succinyl-diaminopimelate desuccinylase